MTISGSIQDISNAFLRMCNRCTQPVTRLSERSLCRCHFNRRRSTRLDVGMDGLAWHDEFCGVRF